ncbi:MAG: ABC transporter ATP-binding protein [Eshraghiella crossota]|uniref:ABC transporter ATP-binding protein n=1 Tax=Eshraghiella crossota TaxID=45851 RepID=UPI00399A7277
MIEIDNIYKIYNKGKVNEFTALKGVSLRISEGEMVAVIGKSGAGKSTLMHIIGCIDDFEQGKYYFNGQDVSKLNEKKRAIIRNRDIGIVLQDFALMENYTVIENVLMPLFFSKDAGNRRVREEKAKDILSQLEMDEIMDKKVNKLSGGQKQRVAIARAMINNPKVILADEPTGALDVKTSLEIMNVFKQLNAKGTTVIIITHDMEVANECNRVIEICDGNIV